MLNLISFVNGNISKTLCDQANKKNKQDCKKVLNEIKEAALNGEYLRVLQLNVNQVHYLETLGLNLTKNENKFGCYEISWKNTKK